jgi:hypothetical protein
MRRFSMLALAGVALMLTGCVYNPYTGTYMPCCSYYGYPYYRYPPPYYSPYGYPAQGPYGAPQAQPGGYYQSAPPQSGSYSAPPAGPYGAPQPGTQGSDATPLGGGGLAQRFANANVTHDGRLTLEQAQAGMPMVAQNFAEIDVDHKGYVTLPEIRMFATTHGAQQAATQY